MECLLTKRDRDHQIEKVLWQGREEKNVSGEKT